MDRQPFYIVEDVSYDLILSKLRRGVPAAYTRCSTGISRSAAGPRFKIILKSGKIVLVNGVEKRVVSRSEALSNKTCREHVEVHVSRLGCPEYTNDLKNIVAQQCKFLHPVAVSLNFGTGRSKVELVDSLYTFCLAVDQISLVYIDWMSLCPAGSEVLPAFSTSAPRFEF